MRPAQYVSTQPREQSHLLGVWTSGKGRIVRVKFNGRVDVLGVLFVKCSHFLNVFTHISFALLLKEPAK
jgi:hypothetical protein